MKWSALRCQVTSFCTEFCWACLRSQLTRIYSNVGDIVDKEASSMSALYRDVSAYPQPIRGQLQDALREYARCTIEEGWSSRAFWCDC
jgi:hypothetical protein